MRGWWTAGIIVLEESVERIILSADYCVIVSNVAETSHRVQFDDVTLLWCHGDGDGQRADVGYSAGLGSASKGGLRGPGAMVDVTQLLIDVKCVMGMEQIHDHHQSKKADG